jgi:nucleoid DNA-binding protein
MAALRTRKEARERIIKAFMEGLDQALPADESVPLKGKTFRDFELQARTLKETLIPTVLEERAALEDHAQVEAGGFCPHCGSDRTYLEKEVVQKEIRSPDGPVVLGKQHARCRACNGSFSPSGS